MLFWWKLLRYSNNIFHFISRQFFLFCVFVQTSKQTFNICSGILKIHLGSKLTVVLTLHLRVVKRGGRRQIGATLLSWIRFPSEDEWTWPGPPEGGGAVMIWAWCHHGVNEQLDRHEMMRCRLTQTSSIGDSDWPPMEVRGRERGRREEEVPRQNKVSFLQIRK